MMSYGYYEMLFLMLECVFFFLGDSHIFLWNLSLLILTRSLISNLFMVSVLMFYMRCWHSRIDFSLGT